MVPLRETMIHMRKAVRVKERGKIIRRTTRRAADYGSAVGHNTDTSW